MQDTLCDMRAPGFWLHDKLLQVGPGEDRAVKAFYLAPISLAAAARVRSSAETCP